MESELSWSLVIATYNRINVLRRCISCAVGQSRMPREIVVVDASLNWQENRKLIMESIAVHYPAIRWVYVEAKVRSSATQRNQGIDLATSAVLFLIDDDSLMFPDCASVVMQVYEADRSGAILGVSAVPAGQAPDAPTTQCADAAGSGPPTKRGFLKRIASRLENQIDVERLLLPYDKQYPDRPLPADLLSLAVVPVRYFHGFRMTYRREAIAKERFDEFLLRYAAAEDLDASYRVSRHGVLVQALQARLFHAQDSSSRLTRYTRQVLGTMNLAVLYRLKGHNPRVLFRSFRWRLRKRILLDILRDFSRRRFQIPNARANFFTLRKLDYLLSLPEKDLRHWYPNFQTNLIASNPS